MTTQVAAAKETIGTLKPGFHIRRAAGSTGPAPGVTAGSLP